MKPRTLRAVSPVVATALLVLIAVATAAILYLWVSGIVTRQPSQQKALSEAIKIDAVSYDSNNKVLYVYVRNIGPTKVKISAAYAIDATTGSLIASNTSITNVELDPGAVTVIQIGNAQNQVTIPVGKPIIVKVVTADGVEAQYLYTYGT